MKKTSLLNQALSEVIASMGHTDMLVVADSGLPVPKGVRRIDLALTKNVPGFMETVKVVLEELAVERAIFALEMRLKSPDLYQQLTSLLKDRDISWEEIAHEEFKARTSLAVAVVRTGEFTPYANVILQAGVVF
ncbi:D-ribose pyranase [Thermanaeromonas toyohensis]|nr:D-ribose pyranase [Thermanaeromonas toyohensis]